jgi:hypothetical protein
VEENLIHAALIATVGFSFGAGVGVGQPSPRSPSKGSASPTGQPTGNAAARELSRRALRLGIDFDPDNPKAEHPSHADAESLDASAAYRWLTDQLGAADDSIAPAPDGLRDFIATRRLALWSVVGLLERETPEWSSPRAEETAIPPRFAALNRLNRLFVASALTEQRAGNAAEARRLMEASWSIHGSLSRDSDAISGSMLASAALRLQVGALRKLSEPAVEWLDRLAREDPWRQAIDNFESESAAMAAGDAPLGPDALSDSLPKENVRAHRAVAEALRRISPCDLSSLSAEEIGRPMMEEYRKTRAPGEDPEAIARLFAEIIVPGLTNRLERAGRLAVEAELTLKILELRLARSGSRDREWPRKLDDASSHICAGATYGYRRSGLGMEIEFRGSPPAPGTGWTLPLSYATHDEPRPARAVSPAAPSATDSD